MRLLIVFGFYPHKDIGIMIHFFDLSFSWADLELKCQNFRLLFSMYLVNIKDALHQAVSFIYRFPHPNVLSRTKSVFSTAMFFQSCAILLLKKGQKQNLILNLHYRVRGVHGRLCNPSYWDSGISGWFVDRDLKAQNGLQRVRTIPRVQPGEARVPPGAD